MVKLFTHDSSFWLNGLDFRIIYDIFLNDGAFFGCLFWTFWSAFISGFFGSYLGVSFVIFFSVSCLGLTFFYAVFLFVIVGYFDLIVGLSIKTPAFFFMKRQHEIAYFVGANIMQQNNFYTPLVDFNAEGLANNSITRDTFTLFWGLHFDFVTVVILVVITSISFFVHVYSGTYIRHDPHIIRFFTFISLFTFFIIVIVTANNFIQLFVGWEGIGLCSFLLIGFWSTRQEAVRSALQAFAVNKVGDFALMLAILLLLLIEGTTSFSTIFQNSFFYSQIFVVIGPFDFALNDLLGFLFFVGAVAKSAQILLHTWLLSAMEGPTPVSALLHAATMVTAGIFLIIRSAPLWETSDFVGQLIIFFGVVTSLFGTFGGATVTDVKKIIALSTCSQLGYMFFACGFGFYNISLFHLFNHAFFKALLFLSAGSLIHALNGEQDIRRIGGLLHLMPMTYTSILFASSALIGFPFFSGFFSKEPIIETAAYEILFPGILGFALSACAAFLTAFYSGRILYHVFLNQYAGHRVNLVHIAEDPVILIVFRCLLVGSIFSGFFFCDLFTFSNTNCFNFNNLLKLGLTNSFIVNSRDELLFSDQVEFEDILSLAFGCFGAYFALYVSESCSPVAFASSLSQVTNTSTFVEFLWGERNFYESLLRKFVRNIYNQAYSFYTSFDQGWFEWFGPKGIFFVFNYRDTKKHDYIIMQHLKFLLLGFVFILFLFIFLLLF